MEKQDKVRENKNRRWAERLGLFLRKSRARHWNVDNYQGYMLVDLNRSNIVMGEKFDLALDGVENFLHEYEEKISSPAEPTE